MGSPDSDVRSINPGYFEVGLSTQTGVRRLMPDRIPRQNKVDAQVQTGRYTDAQTSAFDSLTRLPDDELMQVGVGPAHRELQQVVQSRQGDIRAYQQAVAELRQRLNV